MSGAHPIYDTLVRLYPKAFRDAYGDDVVQHFDDLVADRGIRAAWGRTALDLAVTIPRYRLETIMNERHSATTISVAVGLLAAAGVASMLVGLSPGALLVVVALALAIAQRSAIARALRAPDPHRRRRRLQTAAVLAVVFVASFVAYLMLIGDTWSTRDTVLAIIGNAAMIGAIGFLAAALLTPKTPQRHQHNEAT
jgi:uncharacterized membrane protein YidH (DUF202 family)